jgi:GNAT superfamily N-acetyltransferase
MEASAPCSRLEWDSDFFGCRIGRVTLVALDAEGVERIRTWAKAERIDCLYYLVDAENQPSIRAAEQAGFLATDIRVGLSRDVPAADFHDSAEVGLFRSEEVPALAAIARASHGDTRFYADAHFPRERCDDLYATWIENSCNGYADTVMVARSEGKPVGYLSCHLEGELGRIGLLAVREDVRSRRFGEQLVSAALGWFATQGMKRVEVATQGRNVRALRFYERMGFLTDSMGLWFHLWPASLDAK